MITTAGHLGWLSAVLCVVWIAGTQQNFISGMFNYKLKTDLLCFMGVKVLKSHGTI